ncbi:Rpn family recombination-promoting nuclease/putative transposase [Sporomusa termitida]|uniref:Recombination-promoting nuclease RpnA n=1 Tax=Sporomusa termitida TaxID=2377 RepID=A0A517DWF2_9FIRM|nr:Rpn family recombination-promoting nuclease/putative transposase [Sporomusa termitida]QDR81680.1 Recombination-promoting nuclease RpnA [Sporomusa termitida]
MPADHTSNTSHHAHDKGYKQLLSNKRTFLALLKTFVREEWTADLREENLVRVEKSYILQDFTEKEADIVYEMKTGSNNIIFYCLLELQSTVDYLMPFRLLLYMTEIWRNSFNNIPSQEREKKDYRLPAIIPIVLYNGTDNWRAPGQFKEMLAGHNQFGSHLLDFSYILLDINRYQEDDLRNMAGLIASVFLLDRTVRQDDDIITRLRILMNGLRCMHPDDFRQFTVWLKHVLKPRITPALHNQIDSILNEVEPEEVEAMISNIEIALAESHRRAQLEGRLEGKLAVARKLLLRGHTPADIMDLTELTAAQIQELTKELQ